MREKQEPCRGIDRHLQFAYDGVVIGALDDLVPTHALVVHVGVHGGVAGGTTSKGTFTRGGPER